MNRVIREIETNRETYEVYFHFWWWPAKMPLTVSSMIFKKKHGGEMVYRFDIWAFSDSSTETRKVILSNELILLFILFLHCLWHVFQSFIIILYIYRKFSFFLLWLCKSLYILYLSKAYFQFNYSQYFCIGLRNFI